MQSSRSRELASTVSKLHKEASSARLQLTVLPVSKDTNKAGKAAKDIEDIYSTLYR